MTKKQRALALIVNIVVSIFYAVDGITYEFEVNASNGKVLAAETDTDNDDNDSDDDDRSDLLSERYEKIDIYAKNRFIKGRDIIYI